jgi:hypothetical protein
MRITAKRPAARGALSRARTHQRSDGTDLAAAQRVSSRAGGAYDAIAPIFSLEKLEGGLLNPAKDP